MVTLNGLENWANCLSNDESFIMETVPMESGGNSTMKFIV